MASVFKRGGKDNREGKYYASWRDHTGKRQTKCTGTTDKKSAMEIARHYETETAMRKHGAIDPRMDSMVKQSKRTIEDHLRDFDAKMTVKGSGDNHITRTLKMVRNFAAFVEITNVSEITADRLNAYVVELGNKGRSDRTKHAHITAMKSFTKWLTINHKLPFDPLTTVEKPNPTANRKRKRRILLHEEWDRLQAATLAGPERFGMSSGERCLLYRTAMQTALRSNELRSLTRGKIVVNVRRPYILCDAGSTKNKKQAQQFIDDQLAGDLLAHVAAKSPAAPVFAMPHATDVAEMLRDDLAAAQAAWIDEAKADPQEYAERQKSDFLAADNHEGESLDFHALRHTAGAWLAMIRDVNPKEVQTFMRHSSITLTMDTYGHLFPGQEADAAASLHAMMTPQQAVGRATGTDNATADVLQFGAQRLAQRGARDSVRRGAPPSGEPMADRRTGDERIARENAGQCAVTRHDAPECEDRPGRTRTYDQGIMSHVETSGIPEESTIAQTTAQRGAQNVTHLPASDSGDAAPPAAEGPVDDLEFSQLVAAWSSVPLEAGRAILPHLTTAAVMAIAEAFGGKMDEAFGSREGGGE